MLPIHFILKNGGGIEWDETIEWDQGLIDTTDRIDEMVDIAGMIRPEQYPVSGMLFLASDRVGFLIEYNVPVDLRIAGDVPDGDGNNE